MKLENKSVKQLKKQLDSLVSEFVRRRDDGICIACGVKKPWKEMQNGHYISRGHQNTRYDLRNCNTECYSCNVMKYGNMPSYTIELQKRYGYEIIKELKRLGDKTKQWKPKELIELILMFKEKIKLLES